MTTPPRPPGADDGDIDRWVDELAGRRSPTSATTQVLREVVARRSAERDAASLGEVASDDAQRQASERLRERLRAVRASASAPDAEAGAAGPAPAPDLPPVVRPPGGAAANTGRWRMLAGVALLAAALGVVWQLRQADDADLRYASGPPPVWRDVAEPPRIETPKPATAARALLQQLAPFDTRPLAYRDGNAVLVDFDVQPGDLAAVAAAVDEPRIRQRLRAGANRVVFTPGR